MGDWIQLVGPEKALEIFGVRLVGLNASTLTKVLITLVFFAFVLVLGRVLRGLTTLILRQRRDQRVAFWARQGIQVTMAVLLTILLLSVWFDDPTRLATGIGLVTAGLAFALQRVITAIAGYLVILRGQTFNVGDRIAMGGVRGDVIALGFMQTTIMEMGQPPPVQGAEPAMWVLSRQYTGRVVTVSNARVFDEPVYNYSREFPYLWEEIRLPIPYTADRRRAEEILLEVAGRHTVTVNQLSDEALTEMQRRYFLKREEIAPTVYYRLTDNWLELTVRFVVEDRGMRGVKDAMSREILDALDAAGIDIASATTAIVEFPPLRIASSDHPSAS